MLGIVVSRADRASVHVGEHLRDLADWTVERDDGRPDAEGGGEVYRLDGVELREFGALHLSLDGVAGAFDDPDLVAFASRHSGETGPLLTAHHTGNFGPADHGGADGELALAAPNAHSRVLAALSTYAPEGYEVGTECTHHGPSAVGAPSLFVEVGSGESQWEDPGGARAVARAILELRGVDPHREHQLVGFGGGHYAPRFDRIARETGWAVGHVAADWCLDALADLPPARRRDVLDRAFEASGAEYAVLDGDRPDLSRRLADLGYRVVSETWVRAVDGVPPALVERLAGELGPVSEGLRFGEPARTLDPGTALTAESLPEELLAEAQGVDRGAARAAVAASAVAFGTVENGTRVDPGGRVALASPGAYDALVDDLIGILREEYDEVSREGDAVVASEAAFDPARARELGVPEGPKFGELANDNPVRVDGETILPEAVHTERTLRFDV